ncbi:thiamine pyrophosphate-requiring protein [Candidatus Poribacteria bacterium]|nr:thiamine pyrophosphate-requiring protein [Candidatus Poribacteria bacterium]MYK22403.1 thiamine pyrophosphate-requiring protein [Candidatus Poribacteria bacterium]
MKVVDAVAKVLKAEGVEYLFAYPVNHIIEAAAKLDIRPIIVRQERIGLHMADAMSRITSGEKIGVFCMQSGPGSENAFGGVAQAYGDSAPIVVLPGGYSRNITQIQPNFNSALNYRHVTKSCEQVTLPEAVPEALRRAFTQVRNGRPRPALVEFPSDLFNEEISDSFDPTPVPTVRYGPDSASIEAAAEALLDAECPVIYAGQGVHYAQAWDSLKALAELLAAPVTTSLGGKSAFPEDHPLALGSGGRAIPKSVHHYLQKADLIFGIGCSFTRTAFGVRIPEGKRVIHATLDPADINKDVPVESALVGDAGLILDGLVEAVRDRSNGASEERTAAVTGEISAVKAEWLGEWNAKLTSDEVPMTPYRVIWDLLRTVDVKDTIITHDAGSPRDQMSPFWQSVAPLTYIGWGKTTQLGYGLGLAMGAKLARPDTLCVNVWGDAAIGFTGMDFETAVRERIPILSVLFNNFSMAIEIPIMPVSTEKFRSTDISGHYADMAKAFGGYGERVETPDQIIPAIQRGIQKTQEGVPALLEFITAKEIQISSF